jgi:hypothetical protein
MSGRLTITADPRAVSMAEAIRRMAGVAPLTVVTGRALADLAAELGGMDAAAVWLLELAESVGQPVGLNFETGPDTSSTAFIAPRTWTQERLSGWVAAKSDELEAELGPIVRVGPEFPAPGGGD